MSTFILMMRRELNLAYATRSELIYPIWFYLLVMMLFPLSLGSFPELLARLSGGICWVAALLSSLLSLERMMKSDWQDGTLEQLFIAPRSIVVLMAAKTWVHWLVTGVPLILMTPLLAVLLSMPFDMWLALTLSLCVGTPILSWIGGIGVALTVGLRRSGMVLHILLLPLYIPVLIFATSMIEAAQYHQPYRAQLAMLGAMLMTACTVIPWVMAVAVKINLRAAL